MKNFTDNAKKTVFAFFVIAVLLIVQNYGLIDDAEALISITRSNTNFTDTETQKSPVEMRGYLNIGEKRFENGTIKFEYHLFVDEHRNNPPYFLNFEKIPNDIYDLSGKQIVIQGYVNYYPNNQVRFFSNSDVINVISAKLSNPMQQLQSDSIESSKRSYETSNVPSNLKTVVILSRFSDDSSEPHSETYFQNRWFNDADSLKNYWEDASYGAITMSPGTINGTGVVNWQSLPHRSADYATDGILTTLDTFTLLDNAIDLADPFIDFNGTDDVIQNDEPQIGGSGDNGDDVDQVILVFNDLFVGGNYAFAYLSPLTINTDEGTLYVYVTFTPDNGANFPIGMNYQNGVGVVAHEMGHNFGWAHTPPATGNTYDDSWSIMSSSNTDGPVGVIAFNKDQAGWIPLADIKTVPNGTLKTFTLDILSDPSPGTNYLMGKIPFGSNGEYYTLEARLDSMFDQTPLNQFGLMIYHYNPNGHANSADKYTVVNTIDTTGTGDFDNADLDIGKSYAANDVVIVYLSNTTTSITVKVSNNLTTHVSFPVSSQDDSPTDLTFSSNGSRMFVVGDQYDNVYMYTLPVPFDVTNSTFTNSFNVSSQDTLPRGVTFSSNGSRMFIVGDQNDNVYMYTLPVPFDVTNSTFTNSLNVSLQDTLPRGVTFSSNGSRMFVVGDQYDNVYMYTLPVPFDVSNSTFTNSFNVSLQDTLPRGVTFSSNGLRMFVVGDQYDNVYMYTLPVPFDVTNSTFTNSFNVSLQDTLPHGIAFSSNGTKMFVAGYNTGSVYEYSLSAPFDLVNLIRPTFTAQSDSFTQTTVTFSEEISGTLRFSEWSFAGNNPTTVLEYTDGVILSNVTKLVFTHAATNEQTPVVAYIGTNLTGSSSNEVAAGTVTASDGIIPTFTAQSDSFTQTTVTFSEEISGTLRFSEWSFAGNNSTTVLEYADGVILSNVTKLVFTHAATNEQTPVVAYIGTNLADSSSNEVAAGTVTASDGIIPTFTAQSDSFTQTTVTFSEEISGTLRFSEWSFAGNNPTTVLEYTDGVILSNVTKLVFTHAATNEQTPVVAYIGTNLTDSSSNRVVAGTVTASDGIIPTFTAQSDSFTQTTVTFSEEISGTLRFLEWSFAGNNSTTVLEYTDGVILSNVTKLVFTHAATNEQTPVVAYIGTNLADSSSNEVAAGTVTASNGIPSISCTTSSGNWIITANCTLSADYVATANVLVQNNSVLVIPSRVILDINFTGNSLTVESGSGVLIKSGGTIT